MGVFLDWTTFKTNVVNKNALRFSEKEEFYTLHYGEFDSSVMKDAGADQTDFETNYKSLANKTITLENSAFTSKKLGTKSLFNRSHGAAFALTTGTNTLEFTIPYTTCKITGAELINAEIGDYFDFFVVHPTYGVLGQFAFSNYVAKDFYSRVSSYDADLVSGLILRCVYASISAKTIYINYLLHEVV
jgi:hypothetical protein